MEQVKVEVMVPKEIHELAQGMVKLVASIKEALADGFQPGTDLPVIVTKAIADLPAAIAGLDQIGLELAEQKIAFMKALALSSADMADLFMKKPEVVG